MIPPNALGMPDQYSEWRPLQDQACLQIVDSNVRFLAQVCPTGFGKSLVYMTASQLIPGRTAIITSTKGLQAQLMRDFGGVGGIAEIRGRSNYQCRLNTKLTCDSGMCMFGVRCNMRDQGGCFYFDALREATKAKVVITNYAYWMSQNEYSEGIGEFDMLVLDEAHAAPDHLIDHLSITFNKKSRVEGRLCRLDDSLPVTPDGWVEWAEDLLPQVEDGIEEAKMLRKEKMYAPLNRLKGKLERMCSRMDRTWVWEDSPFHVTITPVWPSPSKESLFLGIPKVVLMSATIVPKTLQLLGVDSEYELVEYPHTFPAEHRPVVHLPTVRMNYKIGDVENRLWLSKLDNIIRPRLYYKGIIHTVSYARRDMVMEQSKFAKYMITHNKKDTESVVRAFKRADAPCILVSPSMSTGWDFPDDEARWQVVVKMPFPDTRGAIMKARVKEDDEFASYIVVQQLVQAAGRGVRSCEDWCETFIIDNNIQWFIRKYDYLLVDWFKEAYRQQATIPTVKEDR